MHGSNQAAAEKAALAAALADAKTQADAIASATIVGIAPATIIACVDETGDVG